ncbi:hypothetical protein L7F22_033369 [Adiantum nelumboides]|nr:hypothetical protein [Adiantum nelumboides]
MTLISATTNDKVTRLYSLRVKLGGNELQNFQKLLKSKSPCEYKSFHFVAAYYILQHGVKKSKLEGTSVHGHLTTPSYVIIVVMKMSEEGPFYKGILLDIRRKLIHWSSAPLSLTGRVVVVNQVLLATMWYITSCWIFSAQAKVPWEVITLSQSQGGLGIIDRAQQSRALLRKLIVKGLFLGAEPWKELLLQRIQ